MNDPKEKSVIITDEELIEIVKIQDALMKQADDLLEHVETRLQEIEDRLDGLEMTAETERLNRR